MKVDEDVCIGYDPLIQNAILNNRYDNLGVATGLTGALLYLLARIESSNLSIDSTMMFTNKRFIIHTIDQIKEKSSDITLLSFLQEKHNSKYPDRVSLFLSEWEYPVILWAIGRVLHHKILVAECSRLLKMFLTPLTQKDHCPKFDNNKQLLKTVFLSLPPTESLLIDTIKTNLL